MYTSGIKFSWSWQREGPDPEVAPEVQHLLDAHAMERAAEMWWQGYREGELHHTAPVNGEPQSYRGWWTAEED